MSETSDIQKQAGGISPNVKIIAALIIGLLLGAWANDEFDKPKRNYSVETFETDSGLFVARLNEKTGEVWIGSAHGGWTAELTVGAGKTPTENKPQ